MPEEIMSERELEKAFPGSQVVSQQSRSVYTNDELAAIETWEDYFNLLDSKEIPTYFAEKVLGDGFAILSTEQKDQLIGLPIAFMEWRFNKGDMGEFVSARVLVRVGDGPGDIKKVIINDGSTGIYRQLKQYTDQYGTNTSLIAKNGLKRSDYTFEVEDKANPGQMLQRPASTYYIDTSAVN